MNQLNGYPQHGKAKSIQLVGAFVNGARAAGVRGKLIHPDRGLEPGVPAAFYGTIGIEPLFRQARDSVEWFYIDNAFFDYGRGEYFRVGRNAFQRALRTPDYARLDALCAPIAAWTRAGGHVLVVEQSDYFMRELVGWPGGGPGWRDYVLEKLRAHTDRPIKIRTWRRDKAAAAAGLAADLAGAWALVTHASAAANEALLAGIPVFATGACAALELGLSQLEQIEAPRRPDGRREWAARLAASQWTENELRDGTAWRALTAEGNQ
jgi:hypothetical protein